MPTVPNYNSQVRESAGPIVQQSNNVFNGADNYRAISKPLDAVSDVIIKARNDADQVAVNERYAKLSSFRTDLEYGDNGYYNSKGKNAINDIVKIPDTWTAKVEELSGDLTQRQKEMFGGLAQKNWSEAERGFQKHLMTERRSYDNEVQTSLITNEVNSAVMNLHDPEVVEAKISNITGAVMLYGQRNGLSDEALKAEVQLRKSEVRSNIIDRMVNIGNDREAKAYFEQHKAELTAKDVERLEKNLEIGSTRGEGQRMADDLFSKFKNRTAAAAELRKIEDPKLREAARESLNKLHSDFDQAQRYDDEQAMLSAIKTVEVTGDVKKIPPKLWDKLSLSQRQGLKSYEQKKDSVLETDWKEYTSLRTEAASPATRAKFLNRNIYDSRSKLADSEYKEMVKLQSDIRENSGAGSKVLNGIVTDEQIFNDGLRVMGLKNDNAGDAQAIADFRQVLNQKITSQQQSLGRALSDAEKIEIKNQMTIEVVTKKGFLFDDKKRGWQLNSEDKVQDIKLESIPRAEVEKIKTSKLYKDNPSNDTIVKMYREVKLGK